MYFFFLKPTFHVYPGFSRTVAFQNQGPSTLEAVFPEGRHSKPGTIHTRPRFPGRCLILKKVDSQQRVNNVSITHGKTAPVL